MKRLLLLLMVSFLASAAIAMQVDGYYINANNDTIKTKIDLPHWLGQITLGMYTKLVVVDTNANYSKQTFKPADVKGYGFEYKGEHRDFASKTFNGESRFFEVSRFGPVVNLYTIMESTGGGPYAYSAIKCIIEKPDSSYVWLAGDESGKKTKTKLKAFFTDPALQANIDTHFSDRQDLEEDVLKLVDGLNGR